LYVRGGDPAETPVYVEGGRLLHPGVFETFNGSVFGILDPSVLRKAYFSSGGFSARYGNALSGVVDLETDGRPTVSTWRAGVNFAGGGATLRKPISKRAGAWASLRFTETSFLLRLHDQASDYQRRHRISRTLWGPRSHGAGPVLGSCIARGRRRSFSHHRRVVRTQKRFRVWSA
ncbi:MAG: hypothetical protein P8Y29_04930, partial [Gemmatimonadota bacterium]